MSRGLNALPLAWGVLWSVPAGTAVVTRHQAELVILRSIHGTPTLAMAVDVFGVVDAIDGAIFVVTAFAALVSGHFHGVFGEARSQEEVA